MIFDAFFDCSELKQSLIPPNLRKFAPKFREVLYQNEASDYFLEVMDDFVVSRRVGCLPAGNAGDFSYTY